MSMPEIAYIWAIGRQRGWDAEEMNHVSEPYYSRSARDEYARKVAMDAFLRYRKVCDSPRSSALFSDCLETALQDAALHALGEEESK